MIVLKTKFRSHLGTADKIAKEIVEGEAHSILHSRMTRVEQLTQNKKWLKENRFNPSDKKALYDMMRAMIRNGGGLYVTEVDIHKVLYDGYKNHTHYVEFQLKNDWGDCMGNTYTYEVVEGGKAVVGYDGASTNLRNDLIDFYLSPAVLAVNSGARIPEEED